MKFLSRSQLINGAFFIVAGLSLALYLGLTRLGGFIGFPLDDAWIHQTYARNLGTLGQFAFIPGQPSAGSTSPLWTALLALGYLLQIEYHVWAYALGAFFLGLNAWLVYCMVGQLWPGRPAVAWLAGLFVALEWHLAWAAASGMETLLFTTLVLTAFVLPPERALVIGLMTGLSVLARPDGLTVLPFALARIFVLRPRGWRGLFEGCLGFGVVFGAYLWFNYSLGGSAWPNTFYAKTAEYAAHRALPLLTRVGQLGLLPFVGAQMLLGPGVLVGAWHWGRDQRWGRLIPLGWVITFIVAYIVRLPVTYQHGRYLIPVIPVIIALGAGGTLEWLAVQAAELWQRVLSRAWLAATACLVLVFWLNGAVAYMRDVQIIETEMVATAQWVATHTPAGTLVAAHDIGALGYFGGRDLLDLAGLVSPEVIPFIRDETQLGQWLTSSGAECLMTFPDWYPGLVGKLDAPLYITHAPYSPQAGGTNMAVYAWPGSGGQDGCSRR